MDTSILHAVLLGILQGLTEFLPVSSSAHLIVVSWVMDGKPLPLALNIALHIGTTLAVLIYFWRDWTNIAVAVWRRIVKREKSFEADVLLPGLIIGSLPAGIIGVLWNDEIEAYFHHPATTILPLALIGILLWQLDKRMPTTKHSQDITIKDAFLIGVGQAFALIPGFSRSGSTILTGRLLKIDRAAAARFSFLLGTPAMAGAALLKRHELIASAGDPTFYVGAIASAVTGCLAIGLLLRFLKRFGFAAFAAYRVALAIVIAFLVYGSAPS